MIWLHLGGRRKKYTAFYTLIVMKPINTQSPGGGTDIQSAPFWLRGTSRMPASARPMVTINRRNKQSLLTRWEYYRRRIQGNQ